jgi:two-component system phosphate regulon response regulator OmpR
VLIEDDTRLAEMVRNYLGEAGFRVSRADSGGAGLTAFEVIVLDLMLPDMDGLDVCQQIWRRGSTIPILMLTTRGDAMGRVVGLEMGADDYLPKPFESRVLLARLRAVLRRGKGDPRSDVLRFGRLEIDRDALKDIMTAEPLEAFDRSIDVHISPIRAVIEDDAKKPRVITVRGARIRVCQGERMRRRRDRGVDGREAIHFCERADPFRRRS